MDIFNIILISLVFISLTVIIAIFGKNLKQVQKVDVSDKMSMSQTRKKKGIRRFFVKIWEGSSNIFVVIAEWIVKKVKRILHLVHFWLIKKRKGKKENGVVDEVEAKKELIIQEEEDLGRVINDDLAQDDEQFVEKTTSESVYSIDAEKPISSDDDEMKEMNEESKKKITDFFVRKRKKDNKSDEEQSATVEVIADEALDVPDEEEDSVLEKKGSFVSRLKSRLMIFKKKNKDDQATEQDDNEFGAQFSDGIVKVSNKMQDPTQNNPIKEVFRAKGEQEDIDIDDELGVDRKILEKKILQKIANAPSNVENYRQLGELYIKMKSFGDAVDAYRFIVEKFPRDVDAKRKLDKIKLLKRLS